MFGRTLLLAFSLLISTYAYADTVHLRRFERINPYQKLDVSWGDKAYTYMDVADTTLDSNRPNDNFGAAKTLRLEAGQDNGILIQFGELNRAIWRGSRITDVKLILHPVPGHFTRDTAVAVYRMTADWRDGGADGRPMYWTATYNSALSSPRPNAVKWSKPGANGASDHLVKPSLLTNTSDGYNSSTNTWTVTGPGLQDDVRYWFGKQYRNYGWLIRMENPKSAKGPVDFHSSDTMDKDLHPELVVTYEPLMTEGEQKGVDLNVTFIERTPRYLRYHDDGVKSYERKKFRDDTPGIMKYPLNADTKKWPDKGEMMTYTAHIKNSGFEAYTGPLDWVWRYNGKIIKKGTRNLKLAPEQSVTESIKLPWSADLRDIRDEKLEFEIDPADKISEITKNNNAESKYIKARTWKYWVERTPYEYCKQFMTAYGSYSFEDYLKWHEHIWNETFLDKSRFDGFAPDGCLQRISLDDFEVVADGRLSGGIHRLDDKPDFHFDGEWGTEWLKGDKLKDPAAVKNIENFMRATRVIMEWSLLHEASHQVLGAFDVYWSNIEPSEPSNPNGKCKIKDGGEHYITRGSMYAYSGLMGGDDTRPNDQYTESTGLYALHTVMGFNSDIPYRNGFYGEWQYDLPRSISVRLLAADGEPIPNANVTVWQFSNMQIVDKNMVAGNLTATAAGVLKLPDQDSGETGDYTTITGHTMLKKNPFGRIGVIGGNTVLLLKIEGYGQKDYRFVRLLDLNKGYWKGYKDAYTFDVQTQITPAVVDWSADMAKGKAVQSMLNPADAGRITDDDPVTNWNGGPAPEGAYIQLDLGESRNVGAVRLYQSQGHGQFFQRFKIEVSDDPSFRTGVIELNRQFPLSFRMAMIDDRDIDPQNPSIRWVTYGTRPTSGRYLRITCLENTDGCELSEIGVYAVK